jgi:hypothetical protein
MILWTIQADGAVRQLERSGVLRGDGRRIWKERRPAFRWMIWQMTARLGTPPSGCRYPLWAWKIWDRRSPRPDLRSRSHLPTGARGARIEFDLPEDRVLLSDFGRWHFVLNHSFLADDEQEAQEAESMTPSAEAIERSWDRIFEIEGGDPAYHGNPAHRAVQATLWSLALSEVRAITWFIAR